MNHKKEGGGVKGEVVGLLPMCLFACKKNEFLIVCILVICKPERDLVGLKMSLKKRESYFCKSETNCCCLDNFKNEFFTEYQRFGFSMTVKSGHLCIEDRRSAADGKMDA